MVAYLDILLQLNNSIDSASSSNNFIPQISKENKNETYGDAFPSLVSAVRCNFSVAERIYTRSADKAAYHISVGHNAAPVDGDTWAFCGPCMDPVIMEDCEVSSSAVADCNFAAVGAVCILHQVDTAVRGLD